MLNIYEVSNKKIENIDSIKEGCWLDLVNPSQNEIKEVVEKTGIDKEILLKMLDEEELPRIEKRNEESVRQFVNNMVDSMIRELELEGKHTKEDRLELIRFMDERGVFLVKGSMEYVAGKLGLSKVTLYGYLDKIHGKR